MMKTWSIVVPILLLVSCARNPPPSLSPAGAALYQANQVVVAIGEVQHVAIALNGTTVCETTTDPSTCRPLLSEQNTRIVVEAVTDALTIIRRVPDGWRVAAVEALDRIERRLDALGLARLRPYLAAARAIIAGA